MPYLGGINMEQSNRLKYKPKGVEWKTCHPLDKGKTQYGVGWDAFYYPLPQMKYFTSEHFEISTSLILKNCGVALLSFLLPHWFDVTDNRSSSFLWLIYKVCI